MSILLLLCCVLWVWVVIGTPKCVCACQQHFECRLPAACCSCLVQAVATWCTARAGSVDRRCHPAICPPCTPNAPCTLLNSPVPNNPPQLVTACCLPARLPTPSTIGNTECAACATLHGSSCCGCCCCASTSVGSCSPNKPAKLLAGPGSPP